MENSAKYTNVDVDSAAAVFDKLSQEPEVAYADHVVPILTLLKPKVFLHALLGLFGFH